jgi:hypothetical protein
MLRRRQLLKTMRLRCVDRHSRGDVGARSPLAPMLAHAPFRASGPCVRSRALFLLRPSSGAAPSHRRARDRCLCEYPCEYPVSTLEYPGVSLGVPCEYTGELAIGADFVHESIVGSTFTGRLVPPPPTSAPGLGQSTAAHIGPRTWLTPPPPTHTPPPAHIGTGNGLAPGPHLSRHWAHPLRHAHLDWAHPSHRRPPRS